MCLFKFIEQNYAELQQHPSLSTRDLFIRVVLDPLALRQHLSYIPQRSNVPASSRQHRKEWLEQLLKRGPSAISNQERLIILEDASLLSQLHTRIWQLPEEKFNRMWMAKL